LWPVIAQAEFDVTMSSEDREPNSHGTLPSEVFEILTPLLSSYHRATGVKLFAVLALVAQRLGPGLAPAVRRDGEQVDADDQLGVQTGGPCQGPGAQSAFLARDKDGMAGSGGSHRDVQRLESLRILLIGLSCRKVGMRLLPDGNRSRPTKQGEGKARQSQQRAGLCLRGLQKSMRRMERRLEQQTHRTEAAAAATSAAALVA
jgi:hypothetical protein